MQGGGGGEGAAGGEGPVRWGIVSLAKINERVFPELRDSSQLELLAVASRSEAAAQAYAGEQGIPRAYGSYDGLLADPEVEAVYLPLPNSLHVEWTIRALEAGKHVLCEKPLDRRAAEVERAFRAAEQAGRILMEAFMYRHHPQTEQAAHLVEAGAIGELRVVRSAFGFTLGGAENIRLRADLDGGSLMDVGCYCVNASRLFAGEPQTAIGWQVAGPTGVDLRFNGSLSFSGPVLAHFDCGFDVPDNSLVELVGSRGTLRIPTPFLVTDPAIELVRDGEAERIAIPHANAYQLQFENLSAAIRGGAEPLLGRQDALGQARTIEALYASADRGGEPVAVAPN
jgi:D-xylose 1-dehydrogenase (NADP+, D-xylono-1,5-lactone-forming)